MAGDHDLPPAIVVRGLTNFAWCRVRRDRSCGVEIEAKQHRHRACADRHRRLHRIATRPQ